MLFAVVTFVVHQSILFNKKPYKMYNYRMFYEETGVTDTCIVLSSLSRMY
jgi:hypothetical protein